MSPFLDRFARPCRRPAAWLWALALAAACFQCGSDHAGPPKRRAAIRPSSSGSPNARPDLALELRKDIQAVRHPSDGGGRAWFDPAPPSAATAGSSGTWTLVYEAGLLGIRPGGVLFFQGAPFWNWSPPQTESEVAPGFTTVSTDAPGVRFEPFAADPTLLALRVAGAALAPGRQVRFVYGAGPLATRTDRYAEHRTAFWFAVDGDGDGVRKNLAGSPTLDVLPGPAARLVAHLPSTARPGERVRLTLAVLDEAANGPCPFEGRFVLESGSGLELPRDVTLKAADGGRAVIDVTAGSEGVFRVKAAGPAGLAAESNPMIVAPDFPRILWADLHGHSNLSDGTGTPEDFFAYARDIAALDAAALTDHDHWGMLFIDQHPEMWQQTRGAVRAANDPGRFVAFLGYEWTSWLHGHHHVVFPGDDGDVLSSMDEGYDTLPELWAALAARGAVSIPHHVSGEPVATDWSVRPDEAVEPVVEIVSVHGCGEAGDCPGTVRGSIDGNFARDALNTGRVFGFVGSGDSHDGHPGLAHLNAPSGGVTAVLSENATREGVNDALRARRTYATNGPRIVLHAVLEGRPVGSTIPPAAAAVLRMRIAATAPLTAVDIIRDGAVAERIPLDGRLTASLERTVRSLTSGGYVYVRVSQQDGGMAWTSPFFVP